MTYNNGSSAGISATIDFNRMTQKEVANQVWLINNGLV